MSKPTASTMSDSSAIDTARQAERQKLLAKMRKAADHAAKNLPVDAMMALPAVNELACKYLDRLEEVTINPNDEQGRGHNRTGFGQPQSDPARMRPEFAGKTIPSMEWVVKQKFPELVTRVGDALTLVRAASSLGGFTVDFPRTVNATRKDGSAFTFESTWVTRVKTSAERTYKPEDLVEGFV